MKPEFAFEKKLFVNPYCIDSLSIEKIAFLNILISQLIFCMKETNENYGVSSNFFRLDFRPADLYEQSFEGGREMFVLDFKWGSKKELEEVP